MSNVKIRRIVTGVSVLASLLLITLVMVKYSFNSPPNPEIETTAIKLAPLNNEASRFTLLVEPRALPDIQFLNGEGDTLTLGEFREKLVLLNIWATWCVPCREEMPTLDRLQKKLGGQDFEVMALSIDRKGIPVVKAFYEELGLQSLSIYIDPTMNATRDFGALGIPTTLLIDHQGNELGRLVGPAVWDDPSMISFFQDQIAKMKQIQSATVDRSNNN